MTRSARARLALATTVQTLAVVLEPADSGAAGSSESPTRTSMASTSRPRASAAVIATTVRIPVPISWVPTSTIARRSGVRVTRQSAGPSWVG